MKTRQHSSEQLATAPCSPLVACEHCQGAGVVPLSRDMLRTWQRLSETKPLLVTALLEDGVTPNAINNRLVALEKLKLAERVGKVGKWVLWLRANAEHSNSHPDKMP